VKKLWLFLALSSVALLFGALLSLFFRDWVRDQVVIPLDFLFWTLRLFILSIPQGFFWAILVLIGLGVAVWASRPISTFSGRAAPLRPSSSVSRYSNWLRYTNMLNTSRFASDNLARDLLRLIIQTLAYQHSLTNDEVYSRLDQEDLGLSPELRAFVRRRGFQTELPRESPLMELYHRLVPRGPASHPPGVYTPIEREAVQIISQIEHLLSQADQNSIDYRQEEAVP
jgi:hypothetical protein